MAIANYSDLVSKLSGDGWFMARDLSSEVDDFIALTTAYLNTRLRCREMEAVTDLSPTNNVCTLPTDYLEYKRVVELASIRRPLSYITEDAADRLYPTRASGLAANFMIVGDSLTALPLSANDIELTYFQAVPNLDGANPTNWLLTKHPGLYLHGCLMYAAEFVENEDAKLQKEATFVNDYIDRIMALNDRAKFGNAVVTLPGVAP